MDAMKMVVAVQDIAANGVSLTIAILVMTAVAMLVMIVGIVRGASPSVWVLASEFHYVDIDLLETHRGD